MRVGIVDVGANTARLLVADVRSAVAVETVDTRKAHLGLGAEIAETGTLSADTIVRAAAACRKHAKRARSLGVRRAEIVVTSPGRQSGDASDALVTALRERSGLPVRVLSADDEGRLAFDGALARADDGVPEVVGVVDVGGGSTELAVGTRSAGPAWVRSVDLGSLRLTQLALGEDPVGRRAVERARELVRASLEELRPLRPDTAFAVGGSARALAKLVGRTLTPDALEATADALCGRRTAKTARRHGLSPSRARTIIGGALLLAEAARTLDRPLLLADGGLREGAALALASEGAVAAA